MLGLKDIFKQQEDIQNVISGLEAGLHEQLVSGLSNSARTLYMTSIYEKTKKPLLIVTHNLLQAQKLYDDITNIVDEKEVFLYPANELIAAEISIASPELKAQRIEVLNYWAKKKTGILIAPVAGLRKLLPPKKLWKEAQLVLEVGKEIDLEAFLMKLISLGYTRSDMVASPGEFSVRGGILDIYPLTEMEPIRIELFDTEIDSIRTFSLEDQRSKEKREKAHIGPATEVLYNEKEIEHLISQLEKGLAASLKKMKDENAKTLLTQNIGRELEQLKNGQKPEKLYKYLSILYGEHISLIDYLPKNSFLIVDEISRVQEMNTTLEKEEADWYTSMLGEGEIIHGLSLSQSITTLLHQAVQPIVYLSLFLRHVPNTNPQNIINISCKQMQNFHGQMNVLKTEMDRWKKNHYTVVLLGNTKDRLEKVEQVLKDYEIEVMIQRDRKTISEGKIQLIEGNLQSGFELPILKLAVLTEEELFKTKTKKLSSRRQKLSNAERIKSYSELNIGDYVVHVNHGIGKYLGIETLQINGVHKDYLHLRYQGDDKLYVPVEQIDLVQKYVGSESKEPKIYKLGGNDWKKVKKKVESSVQDI
ncbi:MAG TPA: CarD family transcriptional regulator, partial [Niallia sp.]|nr:CarD family transcriptional regulator [Niallia sp.]